MERRDHILYSWVCGYLPAKLATAGSGDACGPMPTASSGLHCGISGASHLKLLPPLDELIYAKCLKWFLAFHKHSINVNSYYRYCYYLVMLESPSTGHGLPVSNRRYCVRENQSWKSLFGCVMLGNHFVSLRLTFLI